MQSWPIHEAKPSLSELVKRAQKQPQELTSDGEPVAVVLSTEAYHRQQHAGESLVAADELDLDRQPDLTRDLDL